MSAIARLHFCGYNNRVEIEFDPAKRARTLAERGLDFCDAPEALTASDRFTDPADGDHGEQRWITIGPLKGRLVLVVWTLRGERRRIISMRYAKEKERHGYRARVAQAGVGRSG
jgi:hypothetical protein